MADTQNRTISQLDIANPLSGAEVFPVTQVGETRKSSIGAILQFLKGQLNTGDVPEGSNLYFTNERADSRLTLHANRVDNPHNVTRAQIGLGDVVNKKDNYEAITNPGFFDDANAGYSFGSIWFNTLNQKYWIMVDPTNGNANWDIINPVAADLGISPLVEFTGTNSIVTVNEAAVVAHQQAIDHNQLINSDSERHVNHTQVSINTPVEGGIIGGGDITASRTLQVNLENIGAITGFNGTVDKLPIWDNDLNVLKTILPTQIAAMSAFNEAITVDVNTAITSADRGKMFIINGSAITLTFAAAEDLDTGFMVAILNPNSFNFTLAATSGDNINGLPSMKFKRANHMIVLADDILGIYTIGNLEEEIRLEHTTAVNTGGGTFTAGAFQTRPLNNKTLDTANLCTLASNDFTLAPGKYNLDAHLYVGNVGVHRSQLFNVTDNVTVFSSTNSGAFIHSHLFGSFNVPIGGKTYRITHRCTATTAGSGFGVTANFSGQDEVHAIARLHRIGGL